jgi:hypothetical protein
MEMFMAYVNTYYPSIFLEGLKKYVLRISVRISSLCAAIFARNIPNTEH